MQDLDLKDKQVKKFIRQLNTNYKYTCLITLSMNLLKEHKLYESSKSLAKRCEVSKQKNYGIVLLRLGLLFFTLLNRQGTSAREAVNYIFQYLQNNFQTCLNEKQTFLVINKKPQQFIQAIKQKFRKDLSILKTLFNTQMQNFEDCKNILMQLYKIQKYRSASKKQLKQADKLSHILIGVVHFGQKYKGVKKNHKIKSKNKNTKNAKNTKNLEQNQQLQYILQRQQTHSEILQQDDIQIEEEKNQFNLLMQQNGIQLNQCRFQNLNQNHLHSLRSFTISLRSSKKHSQNQNQRMRVPSSQLYQNWGKCELMCSQSFQI